MWNSESHPSMQSCLLLKQPIKKNTAKVCMLTPLQNMYILKQMISVSTDKKIFLNVYDIYIYTYETELTASFLKKDPKHTRD